MSRRDVLVGSIAAGLGALGGSVFGSSPEQASKKSFRIAHLTDLHMQAPQQRDFVEKAITHSLSIGQKPDLLLTGGDLIYDAMTKHAKCVNHQWRQFHRCFNQNWGVPVEHMIGNHDIWGVDPAKCGTTGSEPQSGKQWAMDELKLTRLARSFDAGGWHIVLLDDIHPLPEKATYEVRLDEEQFKWLEDDLAANQIKPVVIASHAPILSSSVFFLPLCNHKEEWKLPFALMNADSRRLTELFEKYPNVKLCMSGHTHLVDRVEFKGVTYLGHGAVCGNWWKGAFQGIQPGYGIVDLHPDGTFASEYRAYQSLR